MKTRPMGVIERALAKYWEHRTARPYRRAQMIELRRRHKVATNAEESDRMRASSHAVSMNAHFSAGSGTINATPGATKFMKGSKSCSWLIPP
jgi:hypothetical protein